MQSSAFQSGIILWKRNSFDIVFFQMWALHLGHFRNWPQILENDTNIPLAPTQQNSWVKFQNICIFAQFTNDTSFHIASSSFSLK